MDNNLEWNAWLEETKKRLNLDKDLSKSEIEKRLGNLMVLNELIDDYSKDAMSVFREHRRDFDEIAGKILYRLTLVKLFVQNGDQIQALINMAIAVGLSEKLRISRDQ